ncbi:MAG: NAD(+) diphosphatase [Proteobacteria bacterium]|nr:NAD(+) diphosphatase [Pseudomonadota bacterium]
MNSPFALRTPFVSGVHPHESTTCSWWFIFEKSRLLVQSPENESVAICTKDPEQLGLQPIFTRYLGKYATANCFVAALGDDHPELPGMEFRDLRSLFGTLDDDIFCLAGRAIQIVHWHREHRFCGKCGSIMVDRRTELARKCPNCNFISYPRLSPAVIMSVIRDDSILLARAPRFPAGMYSTLAGFVEPGETLEEAVSREVFEEVAISISNVQYVASQPWPFPHSLMIGFTSTYASGDIRIDNQELEDAGWFSVAELPVLPSKISISRLLIDNFIKRFDT